MAKFIGGRADGSAWDRHVRQPRRWPDGHYRLANPADYNVRVVGCDTCDYLAVPEIMDRHKPRCPKKPGAGGYTIPGVGDVTAEDFNKHVEEIRDRMLAAFGITREMVEPQPTRYNIVQLSYRGVSLRVEDSGTEGWKKEEIECNMVDGFVTTISGICYCEGWFKSHDVLQPADNYLIKIDCPEEGRRMFAARVWSSSWPNVYHSKSNGPPFASIDDLDDKRRAFLGLPSKDSHEQTKYLTGVVLVPGGMQEVDHASLAPLRERICICSGIGGHSDYCPLSKV